VHGGNEKAGFGTTQRTNRTFTPHLGEGHQTGRY
jgi:hypothetical protein